MDALSSFLKHASWYKDAENLFFCNDPNLEPMLVKVACELPDYLQGYGFQAWKVLGRTKIQATEGFIIPIALISSEPRLLSEESQPLLLPRSPIPFHSEPLITPALYLILALPPA
ncbi:hypothetical protein BO71DRAFT_231449 [Aspergillus ellipticus CBS 707.79]|uniref:Uncharacterized protein n=1 Tax=Aspergillus ellipticus CBS 707.79 TaxID=1448320 RepID=A0A319DA79_9EURO|nr:hypothetical protein BO71DRAFT_231449 [Aspergillus ellipticus CBS 707.79]